MTRRQRQVNDKKIGKGSQDWCTTYYLKPLVYSVTEPLVLVIDQNLLMPLVFPTAEFTLHQVGYFYNQNLLGVLLYNLILHSLKRLQVILFQC